MVQVLEIIGAGEGNRTLVISLEGIWHSCNLNDHSDIAVQFAPLTRHANSALSERIQLASSRNSGTADGRALASSRVSEDRAMTKTPRQTTGRVRNCTACCKNGAEESA